MGKTLGQYFKPLSLGKEKTGETPTNRKLPKWLTYEQKMKWYSMRQLWRNRITILSDSPGHNSSLVVRISPCAQFKNQEVVLLIDPDGFMCAANSGVDTTN